MVVLFLADGRRDLIDEGINLLNLNVGFIKCNKESAAKVGTRIPVREVFVFGCCYLKLSIYYCMFIVDMVVLEF